MKKSRLGSFILGAVLLFLNSGCASLISGSTQPVTFKSSPDDVTISINGETLGKTPTILPLKRKSDNIVEFSKDGYAKQMMKMDTKMNGWVISNVIWCMACPLSTTTDYASGAAYEYAPNSYFVTLVPEGVTETPTDIKKRKAKSFIVGNYSSIITELSRASMQSGVSKSKRPGSKSSRSGEYLKTLFTMFEIPESDHQTAKDRIKNISAQTKDVLVFADKVIQAFIQ